MDVQEIGGGIVRRTFQFGSERVFNGRKLTRDEILGIPAINRQALIEKKYIEVFLGQPGVRMIFPNATGGFDVIEGRKLNPTPLTLAQASELAGVINETPLPRSGGKKKATKAKAKAN